MSVATANRHPSGSPVGGQFAPGSNDAPPASLTLVEDAAVDVERPADEAQLHDLPERLEELVRAQVPDAREVWFEVYLAEEAPLYNPAAARDVPALSAEGAVVIDSRGAKHQLHVPEEDSTEHLRILEDLEEAAEYARQEGPYLREGDTATYAF